MPLWLVMTARKTSSSTRKVAYRPCSGSARQSSGGPPAAPPPACPAPELAAAPPGVPPLPPIVPAPPEVPPTPPVTPATPPVAPPAPPEPPGTPAPPPASPLLPAAPAVLPAAPASPPKANAGRSSSQAMVAVHRPRAIQRSAFMREEDTTFPPACLPASLSPKRTLVRWQLLPTSRVPLSDALGRATTLDGRAPRIYEKNSRGDSGVVRVALDEEERCTSVERNWPTASSCRRRRGAPRTGRTCTFRSKP